MKRYRVAFTCEVILSAEVPTTFDEQSGQTIEDAATRERVIRDLISSEIAELGDERSIAFQYIQPD